jgi:molybdopterin molybdotransferase
LQPFRGATLASHVLARLAPQVATVAINANRNLPQYQALAGASPVLPDYSMAALQDRWPACKSACSSADRTAADGAVRFAVLPRRSGRAPAAALQARRRPGDGNDDGARSAQPDAAPFRQAHPVRLLKASVLPRWKPTSTPARAAWKASSTR